MTKRNLFPLFQTPIDLSHSYWKKIINTGDIVIDATCGNGHDTLFLASTLFSDDLSGKIIAIDCQEDAIKNTKERLNANLSNEQLEKIKLFNQCHSKFPSEIENSSIKLIVYNLGYLPTGDKNYTTSTNTTLESLKAALPLIISGGGISITCYPGHLEGEKEELAIIDFCKTLSPSAWSSCYHRWLNRNKAPTLIFLQKCFEEPSYSTI